jgi:signal transduction histidine kinase
VVAGGRTWGLVLVASSTGTLGQDAERRLAGFAELLALALESAEARSQLNASRARILEAGMAERRRLERNLHDGAQQRLVALAVQLRVLQKKIADPDLAITLLGAASQELEQALAELRELAHGLYPASLDSDGLPTALQALAERNRVALTIGPLPDRRFPREVERAAYRAVAEALASAEPAAAIGATARNGTLHLRIDHGGAPDSDRIHALGGRLRVTAESVEVQLPCA